MLTGFLRYFVVAAWAIGLAASDVNAIGPRPIERARQKAVELARVFRFPHPIEVLEEDQRAMPPIWMMITLAHTTRSGNRCLLHMTPESLIGDRTIAHEVCHCTLDWDVLGANGYRSEVSASMVEWFEARAKRCEQWLTDPRIHTEVERREGRVPVEVIGR